jgi:hypothetical protein
MGGGSARKALEILVSAFYRGAKIFEFVRSGPTVLWITRGEWTDGVLPRIFSGALSSRHEL